MAYINIPSLNFENLKFDIKLYNENENKNNTNDIYISESLHYYLSTIKQRINDYSYHWDYYKKLTNPYEFIHTLVPTTKFSICKYKPLSRSFFKMIEIINTFNKSNVLIISPMKKPYGMFFRLLSVTFSSFRKPMIRFKRK